MNECIDSTMGRIHVCFAVLLASDDPRTSWSFQTSVTCHTEHDGWTEYLFTVLINKLHMYSSQFNLTRMFLNFFVTCCLGLVILFHLLVNCLRVDWIDCMYVCRVCFDCGSHQCCTVGIYCASAASEWPCFPEGKGFFFFYFFPKKKWTPAIKK
jgi:hypothetical protein